MMEIVIYVFVGILFFIFLIGPALVGLIEIIVELWKKIWGE